jgi:UDP-2-acetamido-3-amino-2,3-dideoxy-glucuronate N-acetyltransferase
MAAFMVLWYRRNLEIHRFISIALSTMHQNFFAHATTVIDDGAVIGNGTYIWHFSHIMKTAVIGANCMLGQNTFIGENVVLGNNVKVQNNVSLYDGVICEDDVFLGPSCVFTNVINPRSIVSRKNEFRKTFVKKGVTIGANATILCGITLNEFAFIGAGAVITKNVAAYAVMAGNPAKQIGWISEHGNKLEFDKAGVAICKSTNGKYFLRDNIVVKEH